MEDLLDFLKIISYNSHIDFCVVSKDRKIIFKSKSFKVNSSIMYVPIILEKETYIIHISKKFKECVPLLKYNIESKYKEIYCSKVNTINLVLMGKKVDNSKVNKIIKNLHKGYALFLIKIAGDIKEAENIIKEIYSENNVIITALDNYIVLISNFDESLEHAMAIRDAINSNLFCKCYVAFSSIAYSIYDLKRCFDQSRQAMNLKRTFLLKTEILDYNSLIFERIVSSFNKETKLEILNSKKKTFDAFDAEMISTIEEFIESGLNISSASKKLYIHRNTLVYRLDKIKRETGFDIRNFKEAARFIMVFLVWKESR
ncbi:MAG: helix-turn-helix domain-containing protein [Clostridium sp.]|nr:helix-turn-helix domain-containing protein [Clostridium sp.]